MAACSMAAAIARGNASTHSTQMQRTYCSPLQPAVAPYVAIHGIAFAVRPAHATTRRQRRETSVFAFDNTSLHPPPQHSRVVSPATDYVVHDGQVRPGRPTHRDVGGDVQRRTRRAAATTTTTTRHDHRRVCLRHTEAARAGRRQQCRTGRDRNNRGEIRITDRGERIATGGDTDKWSWSGRN